MIPILERVIKQTQTPGDVKRLRYIIALVNASRGLPGSARLTALRALQLQSISEHCGPEQAAVAISRLEKFRADDGLDDVASLTVPITEAEALKHSGTRAGMEFATGICNRMKRAQKGDIYELVRIGLIPSAEVLANVIPDVAAQTTSASLSDPHLRQLYSLLYIAFRNRRSVLLLNLGGQLRLKDLPWGAPIEAMRASLGSLSTAAAAKETLAQVVSVAMSAFPETILPNTLLKEFHSFIQTAKLDLPLVDELALDIFQQAFGPKFVLAAGKTAAIMQRTLYASYYGLPCEQLQKMAADAKNSTKAFYELCCARGGVAVNSTTWRRPSENGCIVEQEQIMTTHNLACLFSVLDVKERLAGRLHLLPRVCLTFIIKQLSKAPLNAMSGEAMSAVKDSALAWRQMVFFASFLTPAERVEFFDVCRQALDDMKDQRLRKRLQIHFNDLFAADRGVIPAVTFLAYTTGRPLILEPVDGPKHINTSEKLN